MHGALVAASARWKAASHGEVRQGDRILPLIRERCAVSIILADFFFCTSMHQLAVDNLTVHLGATSPGSSLGSGLETLRS